MPSSRSVARSKSKPAQPGLTTPASTNADPLSQVERLLAQLESLERVLGSEVPAYRSDPKGRVLAETRLRLLHELARAGAQFTSARNIDPSAKPEERARAYEALVRECVIDLGGSDEAVQFLVRTGWHEGAKLTKRVQDPKKPGEPNGPARSFLQMEAQSAKDGVDRARAKSWLDELATVSGKPESDIQEAADELPPAPGSPYFPSGDLVGTLLETDDLFGIYLGRIYCTRTSDPFGSTRDKQADFWEMHWHKKTNPAKKAQFIAASKEVDKWFGWS